MGITTLIISITIILSIIFFGKATSKRNYHGTVHGDTTYWTQTSQNEEPHKKKEEKSDITQQDEESGHVEDDNSSNTGEDNDNGGDNGEIDN